MQSLCSFRCSLELTGMPWSPVIMCSFSNAQHSPDSHFRGPWNRLLNALFPVDSPFIVFPKFSPGEHCDSIGLFTVQVYGNPVFAVEILPKENLRCPLSRGEADEKMRDFFRDTTPTLQIPVLHGVVAFGTKIAFYHLNTAKRTVDPPMIASPDQTDCVTNDGPPQDWWSDDITELTGASKFREIVRDAMSAGKIYEKMYE